LTKENMLW